MLPFESVCDARRLSRREILRVGGLSAFGLSLADSFRLQASSKEAVPPRNSHFGRAKACILLFPYGSPPQHETFDPKPDAPPEIRGELKSIPTNLTGVRIGEGLSRIAKIMDRITVIRSVTHPYPEHGVAYAVSGIPTYTPELETRPRDGRHWPYIGSVVDYVLAKRSGNRTPEMPRNIGLPWLLNSRTDMKVDAGPYAAFLGQAYDPVWAEFTGVGKKIAPKYTDGQAKEFMDPFALCNADGGFRISTAGQLPEGVTAERMADRKGLLEQFDQIRAQHERYTPHQGLGQFREMAFSMASSGRIRDALDISKEPIALREQYGMTLFGQSCLCARRLVEAGCPFVTVFWDGFGQFGNCGWDTHNNHYPRLKEYLLPGFDAAYPSLLLDLEARGMLDETLVLWISEHGRTPKIDPKPKGSGRHHWSRVYSVTMAGGGVAKGKVVGSSDKIGSDVLDIPVSPKDILATAFHLLGIDPDTTVPDAQSKPVPIAGSGIVRTEVLG